MTAAMAIFDIPENCLLCPCFEAADAFNRVSNETTGICKLLPNDNEQNYISNATYSKLETCPLKIIEIKVVDK